MRSSSRSRRQRSLKLSGRFIEHLEDRKLLASIAEFTGLTSGAMPQSITTGPDGNLWFVETDLDKIGRMDPAGNLLNEFALDTGSQPTSITVGADNNLWYTAKGTNKIGRMTTTGLFTEFDVPSIGGSPHGITSGPDGNLWFTEPGANQIGMISTGGIVTEYAGLSLDSQPSGITWGPDGNLWFTQIGTNTIGSIVPSGLNAGLITEFAIPSGNTPGSITTGGDGNLWFTEPSSNSIGQITTTGVVTEIPVFPTDFGPQQIIAGPGGDLYFTTSTGDTIGRIDTGGTFINSYSVPTSASSPTGITVGPDGHIWFTEAAANQIGRLNLEPLVTGDSYTATQDTTLTVNAANGVLANDSDPEGDPLYASLLGAPAHGSLTFNPDGSFTYTPNAGYFGPDSFTYTANDGFDNSNPTTVNLTVNAPPMSLNDSYTVAQDTPLTVNAASGVLANDSDANGDSLTANLLAPPAHGSLTLNPDGSFTYTPDAGYFGPDAFAYVANDGTIDGNLTAVNLTVNAPPVSLDDSYTVNQDTVLTVDAANGVLANDSDPNGDSLILVLVAPSVHGSLALNFDGSFTYTPDAGYIGPDAFAYQVYDGTTYSNLTAVNITVNAPPVSLDDSYTVNQDSSLTIDALSGVLANDSDADGSPITANLLAPPAHGSLTLNADGSFTYTPNAGYFGPDTFAYVANDGTSDGNLTAVNITVNAPPVSLDDSYTVNQDTVLTVDAASGVLANDSDADGSPITANLLAPPAHGSLTLNPDGSFTYTPNAGYFGPDVFAYVANDGTSDGNLTAVNLTVNAPPVATDDAYLASEDTPLTVDAASGVLANDSNADGDPITAVLVSGPTNGSLTLNADGSFLYTPNALYSGTDSFTYKISDGALESSIATVNLMVVHVNHAPVAADDSFTATQDTELIIGGPGVLLNDSDADGESITAVLATGPAHGSLTLYPNGSFSYIPTPGYFGTDSFTYTANDGTVNGNVATVNITVNAPPVSLDDSYTVNQDSSLTIDALSGVLANDTDADGSPITANLLALPTNGTVTFNPDGSFLYTPNAGYFGTDSFTYSANDGTTAGNVATVNITVNAPPAALDDSYTVNQDSSLTIDALSGVLANDGDLDGNPITAVVALNPAHGTLTLNPDGSFIYTPDAGYFGPDSFTYTANDGTVNGNVATVNITVNAPPVSLDDSYTVNQDSSLTIDALSGVLANDTDADGSPITANLLALPTNGTVTFNPDGSFLYTPNAGYFGTDSFTYSANDGTTAGNVATVNLTVNHVNHAPTTTADVYTTAENAPLTISGPGVLANDNDPDGDPMTAVLGDGPAHGTLTLNPDGSFQYTPAANFNGTDSFTYQANDGNVSGNLVTVTLTITPVNQPPVVSTTALTATQGTPLNGATVATFTDVDADEYPGLYTASINWGDGTPATAGTILRSGNLFTVTGDHIYNNNGTFNVQVTVTDPAGGVGSNTGQANVAQVVAPPVDSPVNPPVDPPAVPQVTLTGAVVTVSQMGPLGVPVTSDNTPTVRGTGPAGQLVTLFAGPMPIGQAVVNPDGSYEITSAAMPDGTYTLAVVILDPNQPTPTPTAVQWLGALTVDTTSPTVTDAHYDPRTRQFFVTFEDVGSGIDLNTVLDTSNYLVALPISRTARANVVPLTGASLVSLSNGTATVAISVGNRPWLRRGQGLFATFSRSITDQAGNALAGQFLGSFPTQGPAGTDFVARYQPIGRRVSPPLRAPFLTRLAPRWAHRVFGNR